MRLMTLAGTGSAPELWLCAISHSPPVRNLLLSGTGRLETLAEQSKPSPRIFGKRHGKREACGCGDHRGGVCLDGASSFVKCQAEVRLIAETPLVFVVVMQLPLDAVGGWISAAEGFGSWPPNLYLSRM